MTSFGSRVLQIGDYLGNHPARRPRWFDHGNRPVILFDHDLDPLPNLCEHRRDVFNNLGLRHVDNSHAFNHSGSFPHNSGVSTKERLDWRPRW